MIKDFEDGKPQEKMSITVTQSKQIISMQDLNVASALKSEITALEQEKEALGVRLMAVERRRETFEVNFEQFTIP